MSAWHDGVIALAEGVSKAILALPPDPRRDLMARPIQSAVELASTQADAERVRAALLPVMPAACVQAAAGYVPLSLLDAIAAMVDAIPIDHSRRLEAKPAPSPGGVLRASRGAPALKCVTREIFVRHEPVPPEETRAALVASADTPPITTTDFDEPEPSDDDEPPPPSDWRRTEGVKPEGPAVRWRDEGGEARPASELYAIVADEAFNAIASAGRDRRLAPLDDRDDLEQRALRQIDALAAIGGPIVHLLLASWARALELPGPWCSWAAAFALGSIEGADALLALHEGLERLPPSALDHALAAASALAIAPHPDRLDLGRDLLASSHPIARAVGVDVLARADQLGADDLRRHLLDASVPVIVAAVRAVARMDLDTARPLLGILERWLGFPHAEVAWPAARALLRWGLDTPLAEVRSGGRLATILGVQAAEVLILAGDPSDQARLAAILRQAPPSRATLDALARFGHPGAWSYLVQKLEDDDLVDDAVDALTTLFGARVSWAERRRVPAWRAAIGAASLDPSIRYRRGQPWSTAIVAEECREPSLSAADVEKRLDELVVRARIAESIDVDAWWPGVSAALAKLPR